MGQTSLTQPFSLADGFDTSSDVACRELVKSCQRGEFCVYRVYSFRDARERRSFQVSLAAHRRAAAIAGKFGPLCFAMRVHEGDLYIWTVSLSEISRWWRDSWKYLPHSDSGS